MNDLQKSIISSFESLDSNVKNRLKHEFQRPDNAVETIQSRKYLDKRLLQIKSELLIKYPYVLDPNLDLIHEIEKVLFEYFN
jgi:hypothetical protein